MPADNKLETDTPNASVQKRAELRGVLVQVQYAPILIVFFVWFALQNSTWLKS